ncbi:MAG: TauD/TfdA family dioxygenase [Paracoccaceae bacterium]
MEYSREIITDSPFSLTQSDSYSAWRNARLQDAKNAQDSGFIQINDPGKLQESERAAIISSCKSTNIALYALTGGRAETALRTSLGAMAKSLGMGLAEGHRSAGNQGVVALTVSDKSSQRGFIPYSRKAMNWHTDGYYNPPKTAIHGFILHCVQDATEGGHNQILDPAIAYIRLRDENPAYIGALMHPEAMTIPANTEANGAIRPASIGPVFSVDRQGNLIMRYTARTRSIAWRDDPDTQAGAEFLRNLLMASDPLMREIKLQPGQGIINNNVLHNRTGFDPDETGNHSRRLIYRIRFHKRIAEE